eukprot:scaffold38839_cov64-Phaeocystis_antarctica.AAC.3
MPVVTASALRTMAHPVDASTPAVTGCGRYCTISAAFMRPSARQSAQMAVSCRAWSGTREATLYTSRTILWLRMATVMSEEAIAKLGTPLETQKAACTTSSPSMCMAETIPTSRSVPMHTSDAYVYACARFIIATGRAALQALAHEVSGRSGDGACFRHEGCSWTGERFCQVAAPLRSGSRSAFGFCIVTAEAVSTVSSLTTVRDGRCRARARSSRPFRQTPACGARRRCVVRAAKPRSGTRAKYPAKNVGPEGGAAPEGAVANAGEAVGQAGQREGGAAAEGVVANAGEAVGQASQREGSADEEGLVADAGQAAGQAGQREGHAALEGTATDSGEAFG